jgi:hypothetical protein
MAVTPKASYELTSGTTKFITTLAEVYDGIASEVGLTKVDSTTPPTAGSFRIRAKELVRAGALKKLKVRCNDKKIHTIYVETSKFATATAALIGKNYGATGATAVIATAYEGTHTKLY